MDGWITIGTKLDTKSFDAQIEEVESKLEEIDLMLSKPKEFKLTESDIAKLNVEAEKLTNRLVILRKQQNELNRSSLKDINKSMEGIIKKVGKWGLAVFGVRSAYNFVRQSISTLSQYNEQLATDIEFIRYAVATTLEPVIEIIVELVYKLLSALNSIWNRLFGVSLFSKDLAKNFKNAKNSANAMKKSLAGFDEMNVLNADGSTGISMTPSFDPSKANKEIDNWVNNLIDSITNIAKKISNLIPEGIKTGFKKLWDGLIDGIAGVALIIEGILNDDWQTILLGIKTFVKATGETLMGIVDISWEVVRSIISAFGRIGAGLWNGLKQGAKDAFDGIKRIYNNLPDWFKTLIKGIVNSAITMINGLITGLNAILLPLRTIILAIGKATGKNWTLQTLSIPKIPRLAKGGIVNMPGRGINYAGANIAERAPEAVIPFTDEQVMDRLGQSIARHMTINATVVNSMNGRVLSREIQKIQNQGNFAMNR